MEAETNGSEYVFHDEHGRPLFTRRDQDNGIDARSWQRAFTKAVEGTHLEGMVPHQLRHSAVRYLRDKRIPDDVIREVTGHKTDDVYKRYGMAQKKDVRRWIKEAYTEESTSPQTVHTAKKTPKNQLKVVK